jgi:virulence factor Mce-like protein
MRILRNPALWGGGALILAAVVALVVSLLYINPPNRNIVSFFTQDAVSVRPGDQVRIAGITVGKVKDLELEHDQVRVRALVEDHAFVGDQSQIDVRMLTAVGGYYVNITSLGETPLGAKPIPVERVTMPYNLMRVLADTPKITDEINPTPISESLTQLQNALTGNNLNSLTTIVDAGDALVSTIEKQRGQITQILDLSDEYIRSLTEFSDGLRGLVRKAALTEQTLELYGQEFGDAMQGIADVFDALAPLGDYYFNHRSDFLQKVRHYQETSRYWMERYGVIVRAIRLVRRKIERVLDAETAAPELLATDICMPVPGMAC